MPSATIIFFMVAPGDSLISVVKRAVALGICVSIGVWHTSTRTLSREGVPSLLFES
ncbi:hypothetical protein BJX66DRAFT_319315 [Aspergillus keveii]|uniref:Uncharacterized protein n=1 Tax=Aspergillus keveii TaxID=714993 RepID=A0ABR4FIY7_9EURO